MSQDPMLGATADEIRAEAEEGLLLAEFATRMRLKNRIIVDTLTAADGVDEDAWREEVLLSLGNLRVEAEQSARRMERERDVAAGTGGRGRHEHDYRTVDAPILERRRLVYREVARGLLRWSADRDRVDALLAAARADAAREVNAALAASLEPAPNRIEDAAVLQERLRLLTDVDLPALAAAREAASTASPRRGPLRRIARALRRRR
ncbi:hypothetical protein QDR37_10135 [Amnibacterium sp. CER49]|uniref:hypothetical protein n=1 Tax=Amnibacterium sp. CER49 TaxID=3039161 RepID=UPI00244CE235|nr:hypothetical protein [Amnibacterium sp. CER49]MDH2444299.1 hypothetical protein [Amnibacterium sp. CER49]